MVTSVKLGSGEFSYEVAVGWEKLPPGMSWREVAGVVTDADDNVYVFSRGDHPMVVFDKARQLHQVVGRRCVHPRSRRSPPVPITPCTVPTTATTPSGSARWTERSS